MTGEEETQQGSLSNLVDRLEREGVLVNAEVSRQRVVLGFPPWLVFEDFSTDALLLAMSLETGIPVLTITLKDLLVDREAAKAAGAETLLERRWLPLADGRVAIGNPFRSLPDGPLAGRPLVLAPYNEIDAMLAAAYPGHGAGLRNRRRLGRFLLDSGAVSEQNLALALAEQRRNGGRLGEILVAHNLVAPEDLVRSVAERIGITALASGAQATPLLPRVMAHELRAVAVEVTPAGQVHDVADKRLVVAFADPSDLNIALVEEALGRSIDPQVTDDESLDALLAAVYAGDDLEDVIGALRQETPDLSAYRTGLSRSQFRIVVVLGLIVLAGFVISPWQALVWAVALCTIGYLLYTTYRMYSAWKGWRLGSTINPSAEELAAMEGRDLPTYTILLPAFREKPQTMRALFRAMSELDYPKHKLHGLLLLEADDDQTRDAVREIEAAQPGIRPQWLKILPIPPGEPRTKPKAMIYGLFYSSGDLLTIFDAEDKPDPDQLKKAAWAFQRAGDNVACIQAKLSYYNSRQNLLTRWFTLEYAAWFDMFLPGLHAMRAPIPLGGTSNHFRLDILKQVMSWDPYNVTEDADLGLRFTRAGYRTQMLESTTYEEANSKYKNWLRQRSRWIKGYMQTFLVHTRHPLELYRQLGFVNTLHFMATVGGLIYAVLISPIFWAMMLVWLVAQPDWIPALFPGPIYYMALVSLVFGNFFFIYLGLIGAVGRGQDDLSPQTIIFPVYWIMMSMAGYFALYELIRKPHYWQKTEHGLHVEEADEGAGHIGPGSPPAEGAGRAA